MDPARWQWMYDILQVMVGKADTLMWFKHRKYLISGTICQDLVYAHRRNCLTNRHFHMISKDIQTAMNFTTMKWGRDNEPITRNVFIKRFEHLPDYLFYEKSLIISNEISYSAASVDGIFECTENNQTIKKVLEIKCPWSLRHIGVKDSKN